MQATSMLDEHGARGRSDGLHLRSRCPSSSGRRPIRRSSASSFIPRSRKRSARWRVPTARGLGKFGRGTGTIIISTCASNARTACRLCAQVPPTGDDGCGKEVDAMACEGDSGQRAVGTQAPPRGRRARRSRPSCWPTCRRNAKRFSPRGLSRCSVPQTALLSPVEVKKALAKAAAVNLALYKASTTTGSSASAVTFGQEPGAAAASSQIRDCRSEVTGATA